MEYTVRLDWDPEANVWVATSEDIPGLALESGSIDALIERVRFAAPELIALNHLEAGKTVAFRLERRERLYA